jgi:hypothetical protein
MRVLEQQVAPRLSRAMSEMAKWQEQENGSEVKFQYSNTSSKNDEEKG